MPSNGKRDPDWLTAGRGHVWWPYTQMQTAPTPLPVVRTHGTRLVLADGRELVDGVASWWTACHGYNHPHIRAAVERQLAEMPHVMFAGIAHEQPLRLAQRLAAHLPGDLEHVFYSDSGSVAVEIALKMAMQYWLNREDSSRARFVSFRHGYHGDTAGAMAVSGPGEGMHGTFAGLLPEQFVMPLPVDRASEAALSGFLAVHHEAIAGMIVEPLVQGAGGMLFHDPAVLKTLRDLCDRYNILLIFDEIFTGFGRTGTLFACEQAGVAPDIITLSKGLTAGTMTLAVTVANARVYAGFLDDDPEKALMHGPTFMGNALACAAANASLDLFEREPRLQQVAQIAAQMRDELEPCRALPGVRDVRVKGAIGVVEMERIDDLAAMRARFVEEGVFLRPFGNTVYLTPSFTIAPDDLSRLTGAINRVLRLF